MLQPFREEQLAAICSRCGDAVFSGDLAYVIGEDILCLQCIGECAVIANGEENIEEHLFESER